MSDLFDLDPLRKYMALFVGANGCGKSIAIASWLKKGSVYFFDYDGRMNSVANWYKPRGLRRGQLLSDTYGPENVFDAFVKLQEFAERCPHAAIVIDSFTAVTVSAVTFSLRRRMKSQDKSTLPKTSKGDMVIPDWDEWNGEATYVTLLLDLCKSIAAQGTAVFWTAHPVQRLKLEAGPGGSVNRVSVQTKYAAFGMKSDSLIPIYFNEIYHFTQEYDFDKGWKRLCYTQNSGDVAAKTALRIDPVIDWTSREFNDPTFYDILSQQIEKGQEEINQEGEKYQNDLTIPSNIFT